MSGNLWRAAANVVWRRPRFMTLLSIQWLRRSTIALLHALLWTAAFGFALELRSGSINPERASGAMLALAALIVLRLALFDWIGLLRGLWRYTGTIELERILLATSVSTLLVVVSATWLQVSRAVLLQEWLVSIMLVGGARMFIREMYERRHEARRRTRTLVIGANDTGESLVRDLRRMRGERWEVVGFLDDGSRMRGGNVHGIPVLGPASATTLRWAISTHRVDQVIFASPVPPAEQTRQLVRCCRAAGVPAKTLPTLDERVSAQGVDAVRDLDIADLLGRDPVELNVNQIAAVFENRVVVITGAAGSIGSELARQLVRFEPRTLVLCDHNENALFFVERELREVCPAGMLEPVLGDITDEAHVSWMFEHFKPEVVLHAAAHKHVGMMEANPREGARNNVFGTKLVAELADAHGVAVFVLVSTDKAVRPASVMGATKRACEMVIQHIARRSATRFAAVRFGNVLGSNGSVLPLFRAQIARGGPVTVTHPLATRYFMTIPEAAQLVLQAGALGGTGKIFLLDMGKPLSILQLARDLVVLSGLRPDIDIAIQFCGLKPGEKLREELRIGDEEPGERPHPKIMVVSAKPPPAAQFEAGLGALAQAIAINDERELRRALAFLVPEATLTMAPEPAGGSAGLSRALPELQLRVGSVAETRAQRFEPPDDLLGPGAAK